MRCLFKIGVFIFFIWLAFNIAQNMWGDSMISCDTKYIYTTWQRVCASKIYQTPSTKIKIQWKGSARKVKPTRGCSPGRIIDTKVWASWSFQQKYTRKKKKWVLGLIAIWHLYISTSVTTLTNFFQYIYTR